MLCVGVVSRIVARVVRVIDRVAVCKEYAGGAELVERGQGHARRVPETNRPILMSATQTESYTTHTERQSVIHNTQRQRDRASYTTHTERQDSHTQHTQRDKRVIHNTHRETESHTQHTETERHTQHTETERQRNKQTIPSQ